MSILLFGFPRLFDLAEDDRSMTPSIIRSLVTFFLLPLNISGSDFSLAFYWVCMEEIGVSWSTSAVRRLCMHHVCSNFRHETKDSISSNDLVLLHSDRF